MQSFCRGLQKKSGRADSNRRRPAWEAGILPLNYARKKFPEHLLYSSYGDTVNFTCCRIALFCNFSPKTSLYQFSSSDFTASFTYTLLRYELHFFLSKSCKLVTNAGCLLRYKCLLTKNNGICGRHSNVDMF